MIALCPSYPTGKLCERVCGLRKHNIYKLSYFCAYTFAEFPISATIQALYFGVPEYLR